MTDRPLMQATIEEIEKLSKDRRWDRFTLAVIRDELKHRGSRRAKALLRDVSALLDGSVPLPERPLGADSTEKQIDFLKPPRQNDDG